MIVKQDFKGTIRSMREKAFPLWHALLELIDNSVDAGASKVIIRMDGADLIIEDNGSGIEDFEAAICIGKSPKEDGGKIGRYGVGMKDATAKYSNITIIESRGNSISIPWSAMATGRHGEDVGSPKRIKDDGLTRILLEGFRNIYSRPIDSSEIRRTYQPLIASGSLDIEITGTRLCPLPLPAFTECLTATIEYEGKTIEISGGIYASNDKAKSDWAGYNAYYNGRLIGKGRVRDAGNSVGCTNFAFLIHLIDGDQSWSLATNKDELPDLPDLLDFIYEHHTREMLTRGVEQAHDIALKEIEDRVNALLNGSGNITRAPKVPREPKERQEPAPGSPKRNTFTATKAGSYSHAGNCKRNKVRFSFAHIGGETMGEVVDTGKAGLSITANLDNPFIEANKSNDSFVLFFAKIGHAIQRQLGRHDFYTDSLVEGILNQAGSELAFSANE